MKHPTAPPSLHYPCKGLIQLFLIVGGIFAWAMMLASSFIYPVLAAEETSVATRFSTQIEVDTSNRAQFTVQVIFENNGENPAAISAYDLVIGNVNPVSISAVTGTTVLNTQVREAKGSIIQVLLGESVIRPSSSLEVTISYTVNNFLERRGGAFDAELPVFHQTDISTGERMTFIYPERLGPINYSSALYNQALSQGTYVVQFNNISEVPRLFLSIGEAKHVSVTLERSFKNETEGFVKHEVTIPPEYTSQAFIINAVTPSPDSARTTEDGNIVLTYSVPGNDTLWVRIQGVISYELPKEDQYNLSSQEQKAYLDTESEWWSISEPSVLRMVDQWSDLPSLFEKISSIYTYTKEELILSSGFRELHGVEYRKGASVALKTYKNASVEDYADVFVALARSTGIPARVVAGYVYPYSIEESQLGMFHVWPQYFSEELGWVSVDPAYEKYTNLPMLLSSGLNRVVAASSYDPAFHGVFMETSSEFIPTDQEPRKESRIQAALEVPSSLKAGTIGNGVLRIRNIGNTVISNIDYELVKTDDVPLSIGEPFYREILIPGQVISIPFTVDPYEWFVDGKKMIEFSVTASSGGTELVETVKDSFTVVPLWWVRPVAWLITIIAFLLFMWTFWSGAKMSSFVVNVFRRRKYSSGTKIDGKGM